MVAYSKMVFDDVYESIMLRLGNHRSNTNIDYYTIMMLCNRAIRQAVVSTLPYKEWAYKATIDVTHGLTLPERYISNARVLLSETGNPPYTEARYVTPREFHKINNWRDSNRFALGRLMAPAYTIWGERDPSSVPARAIYLSPNDEFETGTAPTGETYNGLTVSGIMECYLMPAEITDGTDEIGVPYEFEDMVILITLAKVMERIREMNQIGTIFQSINKERQNIFNLYKEKKRTEKRELVSYTEPTPPLAPIPEEQGELKKQ